MFIMNIIVKYKYLLSYSFYNIHFKMFPLIYILKYVKKIAFYVINNAVYFDTWFSFKYWCMQEGYSFYFPIKTLYKYICIGTLLVLP